jgi:hypothetical protein
MAFVNVFAKEMIISYKKDEGLMSLFAPLIIENIII